MEFRSAESLDDSLDWLAERGDETLVLACGTDLMIQHMRREVAAPVFLYIGRLDSLRHVTAGREISIGPLTTHRALRDDPILAKSLPALAEAAGTVGGWQTQEIGTLGGNICNASPAADTVAPLSISNASVELSSADGTR